MLTVLLYFPSLLPSYSPTFSLLACFLPASYGFHRSSPLSLSPNAFGNIFPIVLTVLSLVLLPNFNGKLKKKVPLLPFRKFRYFAKDRCSIRSKNNAGKNEISWMMKQLFLKYFSAPSLLLNSLIHFTRIYILYIYVYFFHIFSIYKGTLITFHLPFYYSKKRILRIHITTFPKISRNQ